MDMKPDGDETRGSQRNKMKQDEGTRRNKAIHCGDETRRGQGNQMEQDGTRQSVVEQLESD